MRGQVGSWQLCRTKHEVGTTRCRHLNDLDPHVHDYDNDNDDPHHVHDCDGTTRDQAVGTPI